MVEKNSGNTWFSYPARFPKRTFPLKVLAAGLLIFSMLGWMRSAEVLIESGTISAVSPAPLPLYWLLTGAVWGIVGLISLIFLWLRYTWSLWLIGISTALFTAWFWLDRAFIQRNPGRWSNWLFLLLANLLLLVFIYSTIIYLHPDKIQADEMGVHHE